MILFWEISNFLYDNQFGFRNKHLATHAITEITEKVREALGKKQFAGGNFIDLQKGFDTVNILLDKLNYYGVKGTSNMQFETFLKERCQYPSINESSSDKQESTHCVLQGSVLGPLLFKVSINDLQKAITQLCTPLCR